MMWFEEPLKIGDVVELRSGGAAMTIDRIEDQSVDCVSKDKAGRTRCERFGMHLLKRRIGGDIMLVIPGINATDEDAARLTGEHH